MEAFASAWSRARTSANRTTPIGGEEDEGGADEGEQLADHDRRSSMKRAIMPLLIGPTSAMATRVGRNDPTPVWAAWVAMPPMPDERRAR